MWTPRSTIYPVHFFHDRPPYRQIMGTSQDGSEKITSLPGICWSFFFHIDQETRWIRTRLTQDLFQWFSSIFSPVKALICIHDVLASSKGLEYIYGLCENFKRWQNVHIHSWWFCGCLAKFFLGLLQRLFLILLLHGIICSASGNLGKAI